MEKLNKEDLNQEVFDLYDDYAHNRLDRRSFLEKLSVYAVGGLTLSSILSCVMPDYVNKIQIDPNDPNLKSEFVTYQSPKGGGEIRSLLSRPKKPKRNCLASLSFTKTEA